MLNNTDLTANIGDDEVSLMSKQFLKYRVVASSNTSHLEAHPGIFRLLMKRIFDAYVLTVTFWQNFLISNAL